MCFMVVGCETMLLCYPWMSYDIMKIMLYCHMLKTLIISPMVSQNPIFVFYFIYIYGYRLYTIELKSFILLSLLSQQNDLAQINDWSQKF